MNRYLIRRCIFYLLGMFVVALSVAISKMSNLGVSPVNSVPSVINELTGVEMGICTTVFFCLLIGVQGIILKKDFRWKYLLGIICSVFFGSFVSVASWLTETWLPMPQMYAIRLMYIGLSAVLAALGIFLYLESDMIPMPGEGVTQALADKTPLSLANAKILFDGSVVFLAFLLSVLFTGKLIGIREGTVLLAFGVGSILKCFTRYLQIPIRRFLGFADKK